MRRVMRNWWGWVLFGCCLVAGFPGCAASVAQQVNALLSQLPGATGSNYSHVIEQIQGYGEQVIPVVISVRDHPDRKVRRGVIDVLARFTNSTDPRVQQTIVQGLSDTDVQVRLTAIHVITYQSKYDCASLLYPALSHEQDTTVLLKLISVLPAPTDQQQTDHLLACLRLPNWKPLLDVIVRKVASEDFARIQTWATDPAPGIRCLALTIINLRLDSRGEAMIQTSFADSAASVRILAAKGARRFPTPVILAKLRSCLKDRESLVRGAAIESLGQLVDADAFSQLFFCIHDASPANQRLAWTALIHYRRPEVALAAMKYLLPTDATRAAEICQEVRAPGVAMALLRALPTVKDPLWRDNAVVTGIIVQQDPAVIEPLRAMIRKKDPLREWAVVILDAMHDRKSAPLFRSVLNDKSLKVRLAAIRALGNLHDAREIDALLSLLISTERDIRLETFRAFAANGDRRAIAPLIASLNSPDESMIGERVTLLAKLCGDDVATLATALKTPYIESRAEVARYLGDHSGARAVQPLIDALAASDVAPSSFIGALARLRDPRAISTLSALYQRPVVSPRAYQDSYSDHLRLEVGGALIAIAGAEAVPIILTKVEDADPLVRRAVIHTLVGVTDPRVLPALVKTARDPDAGVRYYTAQALGGFASPEAVEALMLLCADTGNKPLESETDGGYEGVAYEYPRFVALHAAISLGKTHDAQAFSLLERMAGSTDARLRNAAANGFGALTDTRATGIVIKLLDDKQLDVRIAAIEALGAIRDGTAIVSLLARLPTVNGYELETVIRALGKIGDPRCIESLIRYGVNTNDDILCTALSTIDDPRITDALILLVRDGSRLAMETVGQLKSRSAVPALLTVLDRDESLHMPDAIRALAAIEDRTAIPHLIAVMEHLETFHRFSYSWQYSPVIEESIAESARVLTALTGQRFGEDAARWRWWWEGVKGR